MAEQFDKNGKSTDKNGVKGGQTGPSTPRILPPPFQSQTQILPQVKASQEQQVQQSSRVVPATPPSRNSAAQAAAAIPPNSVKRSPLLTPMAIFIVLLALWVSALPFIAGLLYDRVYQDRVYLGVSVMGIPLGGLTREQAKQVLTQNYNRYAQAPLTIHWKASDGTTHDWQTTPTALGLNVDIQQLVDQAYNIGRGKDLLNDWRERVAVLGRGDQSVVPAYQIDSSQQASLIERIAGEVNRPAVNASIKVAPDGSVQVDPGQVGRQVDIQATVSAIEKSFQTSTAAVPGANDITLIVNEVQPSVTAADVQGAQQAAEKILAAPVKIQFQNQGWTLDRAALASLLAFTLNQPAGSTNAQVQVALNQDQLLNWFTQIARTVNRAPRDARLNWNGGKLQVIASYESQDGYTVDVPAAMKAVNDAVHSDNRTLQLPVIVAKSKVDGSNLNQLGIKELVSSGQTSYAGSIPERTKNVRLAASKLNGIVVPPGATFSYNAALGPVTKEAGYEMGFAIIGPDTVPDVGGGVCQVATTLFQSVFWGGYEVLERYPHPYAIARYEQPPSGRPGLDASVSDYLDFVWKNNSDSYVLIQSRDDQVAQKIVFDLYSTKPGWQVSITGPTVSNVVKADPTVINQTTNEMAKGRVVQVESARDGYDVTIVRTVKRGDQVVSEQKFISHYRPERNVILTGTGS